MIERILFDFLTEKMSVPVYMEEPKKTPPDSSMIVIEKTGSTLNNHVSSSTFAVQSYGASLFEAAELNDLVKKAILDGVNGIIALDEITGVELNSDYNFTDTTSKRYRYQAVIVINHY